MDWENAVQKISMNIKFFIEDKLFWAMVKFIKHFLLNFSLNIIIARQLQLLRV